MSVHEHQGKFLMPAVIRCARFPWGNAHRLPCAWALDCSECPGSLARQCRAGPMPARPGCALCPRALWTRRDSCGAAGVTTCSACGGYPRRRRASLPSCAPPSRGSRSSCPCTRSSGARARRGKRSTCAPSSCGAQRCAECTAAGERPDRAPSYGTACSGVVVAPSTALVGSPSSHATPAWTSS